MSNKFASLTAKQKKVYNAIENYIKTKGIPPTVREIGEMLGEKTPGAVQGILNRLELKGVIKRQIGMARSIQLVTQEESLYEQPVFVPMIKKISRRNYADLANMYNVSRYIPLYRELVREDADSFLLRWEDDSLDGHGIKPGDLLLACTSVTPQKGKIYIILYENLTLLRVFEGRDSRGKLIFSSDNDFLNKSSFDDSEIIIVAQVYRKISSI